MSDGLLECDRAKAEGPQFGSHRHAHQEASSAPLRSMAARRTLALGRRRIRSAPPSHARSRSRSAA